MQREAARADVKVRFILFNPIRLKVQTTLVHQALLSVSENKVSRWPGTVCVVRGEQLKLLAKTFR